MDRRLKERLSGPVVLLFGPLALSFDNTAFTQLRKSIVDTVDHRWILETVAGLPQCWDDITAALPSLQAERGRQQLVDLKSAIETGRPLETPFPLPNKLLIPLVVISHLLQYVAFLGRTSDERDDNRIDPFTTSKDNRETLGFCTGLLSAFAISAAGSREQFSEYGGVAVRLGLLIGMVVDAQDAASEMGMSKSLSTSWDSVEGGQEMLRILKDFPEAYVSVFYDKNRSTITTAASTSLRLQRQLKASGMVVSEIGLYGRFHREQNSAELGPILDFCNTYPAFQFPRAAELAIPTWSNRGEDWITHGTLHQHALQSILVQPPQWFRTVSAVQTASQRDMDGLVVVFGSERCVPPSLMRGLSSRVVYMVDLDPASTPTEAAMPSKNQRAFLDSDIAVVGMSCKVAGADNVEEFWDRLCAGKSQHTEVPKQRIGFETVFRDADADRKWFGNFINGHDTFDHKFFKKSPRESATMDPQQRQLLQAAYQAVEQSGYFHSAHPETRVGCYVGVCACDYENNVACHPPNAFTATGNLQGFIAGKVSHYFGWTGPGLTIDTACSSSAVAVHQACRAILSGECNAALAGGTHVMTSPLWFQNLAGASFLSPTGQCKPFDSGADGYCRGEGVATVFLKKLSTAMAEGDQVLGVIAATAVQQNQNCTPIFVPNVPSLADLFRVVTQQARLEPAEISVVEAHGTGTAVGDPAEYDSIRQVLGGSARTKPLMLGSVKGLVGHIECTSGLVSLIKILLMIQKGTIPPQASFSKINPAIKATFADNMSISEGMQAWDADFRAALINNYGASGSNASIVLTQPPFLRTVAATEGSAKVAGNSKHPFWFCGLDDQSLRRYSKIFRKFLGDHSAKYEQPSISNISLRLARQSNRRLDRALIFSVRSADELQQRLAAFEKGDGSIISIPSPVPKPVVFCFGGQISTFVGLDQDLYQTIAILRKHLDVVDTVARSLGADSIFPYIFERKPVSDPIRLQTMLFAIQYASARSWMDCGIQPVAVVGHSFGELTALCISQILSLEDTLKMILNRATLIRDAWGTDKGAMMALEADLKDVENLLAESSMACHDDKPATVACYNGPRSFTLAGSSAAIDAVADTLARSPNYSLIRAKRLNVSNAFHCALVDPLLESLEQSAKGLTFRMPTIPMERATEFSTQETLTPKFLADHMRCPVFFNQAIHRLAERHASCVFLEAGSNSTITSMASRALGRSSSSGWHFQAMNITSDGSWDSLTEVTIDLWKAGVGTQHWAHQPLQTRFHTPLLLPPYQFDPVRHWIETKPPPKATALPATGKPEPAAEKPPEGLLTFVGYQDSEERLAKFRINTMIPKYEKLVTGHVIAHTAAICPATVQLDLVLEAVRGIRPDLAASKLEPQLSMVENQSPICINPARAVWIEAEVDATGKGSTWNFQVSSTDMSSNDAAKMSHTTGKITFRSADDLGFRLEFARFERQIGHPRCVELLQGGDAEEILQSRNIYKMFAEIVDYGEEYRGLQKLVSSGNLSAGCVVKTYNPESWLDAHLADSFCQVGGIWVNCMTDRSPDEMFIANGIEGWIRSPKLRQEDVRPSAFHVIASHHRQSDKAFLTDVFVFSAANGTLLEVILGISYVRIPKASMSRMLSRLTAPSVPMNSMTVATPSKPDNGELTVALPTKTLVPQSATPFKAPRSPKPPAKAEKQSVKVDVAPRVKAILAELSGLELQEIKDDSQLADLGIDSLLGMEMAHEIEVALKVTLPENELMAIVDMPGLISCVQTAVGIGADSAGRTNEESGEDNESDDSDTKSDIPSVFTSSDIQTAQSTPMVEADTDTRQSSSPGGIGGVDLKLPFDKVREAFNETKKLTDERIIEYGQKNYVDTVMPMQTQMCIALTLEAFEQLGYTLRDTKAGDKVARISPPKEHSRLVDYLYRMLEIQAGLIRVEGECIMRTAVPIPAKSSKELLQDLLSRFPDQSSANRLAFYTGSNLAQVLRGTTDGIKLIFGTPEGRELVSGLYASWPLNRLFYTQMEDFLSRLVAKLDMTAGPLKILEMGAGTGGTTQWIVPRLAQLNIPVEYTFTDLAPSFVSAARKKFKPYSFMKFRTHDIEKAPEDDLIGTQHIIIASNAVHATHSLSVSAKNMRKALRSDGFIMILEMTGTLYWVDMIFGLFEGWWFFDDGRTHAVAHESRWEKDLHSVGYGHVDWTDGSRPENKVERLIIAMGSSSRCDRIQIPSKRPSTDCAARQAVVDRYVREMTNGFTAAIKHAPSLDHLKSNPKRKCVLLTGATGSLGSHLVANIASLEDVASVVCLNRRSKQGPRERQRQALSKKGLFLSEQGASKLCVFETDLSKPNLGLPADEYENLVGTVTHIVHNAWLMNAKWPVKKFEPQLRIMRNMLDLAREVSNLRPPETKVTFQFISSIATVGHWPLWTGEKTVPEERMTIESVLPTGYGDAKYICELMLDETLHKFPDRFRAMTVRPGQIAGSTTSGYWNPLEHLSFLVKSSQTLKVLPEFDGVLSWTPVNDVAGALTDILMLPTETSPFPVYHIDNPIRQPWKEMIAVLAGALDIPLQNVIPFQEWVQRVREYPRLSEGPEGENPSILLIDFLDDNFIRMSCGGLLLDTKKCQSHSQTLAEVGPVSERVARLFIKSWRDTGFLI